MSLKIKVTKLETGGNPKEAVFRSALTIPMGITDQYLLVEFSPDAGVSNGVFKIKAENIAGNNTWRTELPYNVMTAKSLKWSGKIATEAISASLLYYNMRTSLRNREGYETELGPKVTTRLNTGQLCFIIDMTYPSGYDEDIFNYDWDELVIHITEGYPNTVQGLLDAEHDKKPYYVLTSIDRKILEATSQFGDLVITVPELNFKTYGESDLSTSRSAPPPFTLCEFWQDKLWIGGCREYEDTVLWSRSGQPESFDLSDQWLKVGGDGSPLTALCALGDKLLMFKATYFSFFYPTGEMAARSDLSKFGIGTLSSRSPVTVFTENGLFCFFQGSDGHFYLTDGLRLVCISRGRLDNFVAGLNFVSLNKTIGIWSPQDREIRWSVCTGAATKPDKTVVYDLEHNSFYLETAPADLWALDRLRAGSVNKNLILGVQDKKAFYCRNADSDLGNAISMDYETADINFGDPELFKSYVKDEISVKGASASQQLKIEWFLDEKVVAKGNKILTLTAGAKRYDFNTSGMQKRIRYRMTNSDVLGQLAVGHLLTEFEPIGVARR